MGSFETISQKNLKSVGVTLHEFIHTNTGARHFHLESADENNAFMVAFPTRPTDSTGVAHILEHTVLCGSERYPVRDPFFMMLRRSLNTYMNAFTAGDTTAYPFATRNKKDFNNLLAVYLDAVFFPKLDRLDFAQEGWRVEHRNEKDGGGLSYHGVVYNEMKGAMSSPIAQLWNHLHRAIYPNTIYAHNSGGEPCEIPKLKYSQLCEFHKRHYNPANAVFMTYGDLSFREHQEHFEKLVLKRFKIKSQIIEITAQKPFSEKQKRVVKYSTSSDPERSAHAVWAWVFGKSTDADSLMEMHFLTSVLLEHSGSPLRKVLETLKCADAPSELCGIDDSTRQIAFVCGVEGANKKFISDVEKEIFDCLHKLAKDGLAPELMVASLDRLELDQRDWGGGTYPHGLSLMGRMLSSTIYRKDPIQMLDLEPALDKLRTKLSDPNYFKQLVNRVFLNNPHHASIIMLPTSELDPRMEAQSLELQKRFERMESAELNEIRVAAEELKIRQSKVDDESILPKVTLGDIPEGRGLLEPRLADNSLTSEYEVDSNGVFRLRLAYRLTDFSREELELLPLFCGYLTEFGSGIEDYVTTLEKRGKIGDFSVSCLVKPDIKDKNREVGFLIINGKGLGRKRNQITEIAAQLISKVRFDELNRLADLMKQTRSEFEQSLTARGHQLAMTAASRSFSRKTALDEVWEGGSSVSSVKNILLGVDSDHSFKGVFLLFEKIRRKVLNQRPKIMVMGEANLLNGASEECESYLPTNHAEPQSLDISSIQSASPDAWLIDSQVNFCALAYPTVEETSSDAPSLFVLGKYLQDGFLHSEIREKGGAYGSGSGYFPDSGTFKFFSYRDPRLFETVTDFKRSLDWFAENHCDKRLEESILGAVRSLDPSRTPVAEADRAFLNKLFGRDDDLIKSFRAGVLAASCASMSTVCDRYLNSSGHIGIVSGKNTRDFLKNEGLSFDEI